ncbi:MAG: hypothetical protein AAGC81_06095 [Pseudomonadota bacterium]
MSKEPEELKDADLDQAGGKGERGEFIEIYNPTGEATGATPNASQDVLPNPDARRKKRRM